LAAKTVRVVVDENIRRRFLEQTLIGGVLEELGG
jgi:hypothetical protein